MRIVLLIIALLMPAVADATVYWAGSPSSNTIACNLIDSVSDDAASDPLPATYGTPERAAECAMVAGDIVNIKPGTYTGANARISTSSNIPSTGLKSGALGNPTFIQGVPGQTRPVLQVPNCITFNDNSANTIRNFITIRHLVCNGTGGTDPGGGEIAPEGGNITIEDVEIYNACRHGVAAFMVQGTTGIHHLTIRNSKIHDTNKCDASQGGTASTGNGYGIYYSGADLVVEYTEFYNMAGLQFTSSAAGQSVPRPTLRYSYIHDLQPSSRPECWGVTYEGTGARFHNNIINLAGCNVVGTGHGFTTLGSDADNGWIFNNLIINAPGYGIQVGAFSTSGGLTGIEIRNNIILDNTQGTIQNLNSSSVTSTNNKTNGSLTDCTVSSSNFVHKAGSSCINQGIDISGFNANGLPDQGPFETFVATLANASGNTVDVTLGMSVNVPVLPATGQTTWTVKFGGAARTTVSAGKLSGTDSVVRIQYDGAACNTSDVMTVEYAAGTVTDSVAIGGASWANLKQPLLAFTGLAVDESGCSGSPPPPPSGPHIVYHLNDGSGTTITDSSGNANDGSFTGTPGWTTGTLDGAIDFVDQVDDFITAPWGSGLNPTSQSATICLLVAPDSTTNQRWFMGVPFGSNQRTDLSIQNGFWIMRLGAGTLEANTDFPVSAGYAFPCIELDAATDTATLIVNAVRGTSTTGATPSVKTIPSITWAGNWTFGKANGFATSFSPGGVIDEIVVYQKVLTPTEMTELYQSMIPSSPPPPSSTREQKGHKFQRPFKKSGAAEDLRGVDEDGRVSRGGYVDVVIQLDCTGDDCPSFAPRIHRSIDGGATYAQINDVCGVICFSGTSTNPDLVSADAECCLKGVLTEVDGPTNFTSAAVPNITLSQDHSITLRYKLKVDASATPGQEIYLKVFDQNGNELEGGYTPALGAKLTVKDYANGGGF